MPKKTIDWVTTMDAAALLKVDPATTRLWASKVLRGERTRITVARRLGRTYYVSLDEIHEILHTNET